MGIMVANRVSWRAASRCGGLGLDREGSEGTDGAPDIPVLEWVNVEIGSVYWRPLF